MHFFVAKDKRLEYVAFKLKKIITFKISESVGLLNTKANPGPSPKHNTLNPVKAELLCRLK